MRGLRTAVRHPEVLEDQLAAIAQAAAAETAEVWVMAPMVSTVDEAEQFVAACAAHGLDVAGVMIEVPSAALLAGPILAHAAFASIGTNDLTQYTMAADRLLGAVAELSDPWQPAVLHLVAAACAGGARRADRSVSAARPRPTRRSPSCSSGSGVSSLSMTPRALADVAALLAATSSTSADGSRGSRSPRRAPPTRAPCVRARAAGAGGPGAVPGPRVRMVGVRPDSFYAAMGGHETFVALVDEFYRGVADDPVLRPMYPEEDLGPPPSG